VAFVLLTAVLAAAVTVAAGAPAESQPAPRTVLRPDPVILPVPDAARRVTVVPAGRVRATVVIALHGYTAGPDQVRTALGTDAWADELAATLVYPIGLGARSSWNAGGCCGSAARSDIDDVGYLSRLITGLRGQGAERVFLVGYSNGGMLAYRVGCERPELIDGIAVVNATITVGTCDGAFDALHLAGELDPAVPVDGAELVPYLFTGFRPLADLPDAAPNADLDVRVLAGVGHEIPASAHELVTGWLRERV
jgi:poly(3-hydroxybutyrate) depolymerase